MATTLGHALCGVVILLVANRLRSSPTTALDWPNVALFALLANLPDMDMLVSYLLAGDVLAYHGGVSHGLLFALLAAWLTARLVTARADGVQKLGYAVLLYSLVVVSHDLIDSLTGPSLGWHATRGMPLFWPLSDFRLSMPLTLFPGPQHNTWVRLVSLHNLKVMAYEALVFLPPLVWLCLTHSRPHGESRSGLLCLFPRRTEK